MKPTFLVPFLCILVLFVSAPQFTAHAEEDAEKGAEDMVELAIGDEPVEIEHFLRALQKSTGISLMWNPADKNIRGKKIIGGIRLRATKDELFARARSMLTFYELVFIPLGSTEEPIWTVMDARQTSSILKLKPEAIELTDDNLAMYEGKDGMFVTTTIEVEHMADLRQARNALTRIVTGSNIGNVTEVPSARSFVVSDFAPNVVAIYRLLKRMDRPNETSSTTAGKTIAIELAHAVALEAASTLTQLFEARTGGPQGRRPAPAVTTPPTAPRIVADVRTNQLLVTGAPAALEKVREAVTLIDVPVESTEVEVSVVQLEHTEADHVAEVLNNLIQASTALWRGGPRGAMPVVVPDSESDTLLISGNATALRGIQALVGQLDKDR